MKPFRLRHSFFCISVMTLLTACTAQLTHFEARQLEDEGKHQEALAKFEEAAKLAPRNVEIRRDLIKQRDDLIGKALQTAQAKALAGEVDEAERAYREIYALEPNSTRANQGLAEIEQMRRLAGLYQEATRLAEQGRPDKATVIITRILAEKPNHLEARRLQKELEKEASMLMASQNLSALYTQPVSLEFRDVPIAQAFEALARTTNINFVLDKDVRPDLRATLFLRQTYLEDAVNMLLATNRLEKKVLNERSVLIYPADPAKTKEYLDLVVRAFYLDHSDAKQIANTLKTLLKIREAIPDEKLNMILVRDTPEAVALAERIVRLHEIPEAEVMLEVEVLEVTRTKLMELGVQWPNQASFSPLSASGGTSTTLADLRRLNDSRIQATVGSLVANLKKTDSDVNLLANPRIRVRNKSKAKILIGDKVPIITTTSTATGFVSESVQYVDVGLKLEVEPRVAADEDVTIRIGLEVSSLTKEVKSAGGTLAYQIGTRNADTLLKLRSGETQILAGLLNDEERSSGNRVPFVGDIPMLGRLFGSQKDERSKTEIILSITPRIVQMAPRPSLDAAQFWSGSEGTLRTRPLVLASAARPTKSRPHTEAISSTTDAPAETRPEQPAVPATAVTLAWHAPSNAKQGEIVTVDLNIKTDGSIRSLPFQVGFDPAAVEIIKVEEGGFFQTEAGQATLSSNIDISSGKLFASITRNTVDGVSGNGRAAVVSLRPRTGDKPIELRLIAATPINLSNQVTGASLPASLVIPVSP